MGIITQGHALSEDLGPGMGRGMGMSTQEQDVSNIVGPNQQQGHTQQQSPEQGKGTEVQPGQQVRLGQMTGANDEARRKRVPGYPQDMIMFMDQEVAKPETYGLPPGWTGSFMGMMTMVRVLPPDIYEEVTRRVREGIVEPPSRQPAQAVAPQHEHGE